MQDEKNTKPGENVEKKDFKSGLYRTIKTYVLRQGRLTSAQERDYNELSPIYCIPFKQELIDFKTVFGNDNPVIIEIGFGMGQATVEIAKNNPDINYLGIEVHKPGVGAVLGEIKRLELKNLYIVQYDALDVLEQMIKDESVSGFHIFFADPWPKKKHHKRRLVQRPRTNLFEKKLVKGGYVYFVTDWQEYADFALEELSATEGLKNKYEGFAEHQTWRPLTKFEKKGLNADRKINELFFKKV
ncbi:MAG: tRNA (guanosine(46)-N7)-methyltransferase TrmB [Treponema sp.]|uniref:tRNA (guanosine(46)-N7)-methyltransferase TrmB n=1 Tax=Treponema sp. TaxID=166 RepID=UPI00298E9BA7|nr:tRNA (guanosine(46)-N7)-methyltransferase TrmB [Treponema sp.]MCR5386945.1 tRNA (guanosine(46)-N7)-methyltransferase TrmB [Treponema sp.]